MKARSFYTAVPWGRESRMTCVRIPASQRVLHSLPHTVLLVLKYSELRDMYLRIRVFS